MAFMGTEGVTELWAKCKSWFGRKLGVSTTATTVSVQLKNNAGDALGDAATIPAATTTAAGAMTADDKAKLAGIDANANAYTHPAYTANAAAFKKVGNDATGHVVLGAAVAKSDITALGIPAQDTTYDAMAQSEATTGTATTARTITAKVLSDTIEGKGYTKNTGTVTKVSTGAGLTGGDITGTGTVKAKLKSETAHTADSAAPTNAASRQYPVGVDKSGYLSVNVPWTDTDENTEYSAGTGLAMSGTTINHSNSVTAGTAGKSSATSGASVEVPYVKYDAQGHVTESGTHTHTIGSLAASAISSGTLDAARLPTVAVEKGGTGAATASAARTNLDVYSKSEVDGLITTGAAFQGTVDANATISGSSYKAGWYWVVATAGTYVGQTCEVGDMIYAIKSKGTSYSAGDFSVVQNNLVEMTAAEVDAICV